MTENDTATDLFLLTAGSLGKGNRFRPARLRVGGRGFEPLTSSASRKRCPPELTARGTSVGPGEAGSGIEPLYGVLQTPA
jgi:hypothetical protein